MIDKYFYEIATGRVKGQHGTITKASEIMTVSTDFEIDPSSRFLSSPERVDIVSDDAQDSATGVGLRKVIVVGLDANFEQQHEFLTLDGTTPVTTDLYYLRLSVVLTYECGSLGLNQGTITITSNSTSLYFGIICPGCGRSWLNTFTFQADHTGSVVLIRSHLVRLNKAKDGEILVRGLVRNPLTPDAGWNTIFCGWLSTLHKPAFKIENPLAHQFGEKSDILITYKSDTKDLEVHVDMAVVEEHIA